MVPFVGLKAAIASAATLIPAPPAGWPHDLSAWRLPVAGVLAAVWLAAATWAVIRGARARLEASAAREWALRLRGLLMTSPGGYIIVGGDGSASTSENVREWLGLGRVERLEDLAPGGDIGLVPDDLVTLRRQIEALTIAGEQFSDVVRSVKGRRLMARGLPAPPEVAGPRGAVIWLRETTQEHASSEGFRADYLAMAALMEANSALASAMPVPMWVRGPNLRLARVNPAYAAAVNAESPERVVADGVELAQAISRPAAGNPHIREETVIIDGARRLLRIIEVPLPDGGVGGLAIDVTEREEARAERDRLERAQTDTLNRLSAGVALFAADRGLTFFNKAFATLFKLEGSWLDERPEFDRVLEQMRDSGRLPEQRDFPSWRAVRRGWFNNATQAIEETWPLPDTSIIHVIAQPHPDGGLLMVFEDRSEQLRLASSRDTLARVQQATLDNLHEGVAVFSADGRLQFSNARLAEIWRLDPLMMGARPHIDEILAETASLTLDDTRAATVRETVRATTSSERREARTARLSLTDGRLLDFAAVPLPDGNALFTYLDVTDSARIEIALRDRNDALEAADRLKSAFVANVSYELRTPLTAISGFGEMLAAGYVGTLTERQAEYVGSIMTSSQRLQLLIDDILDLAITEAGELELDIAPVMVAPVVRAAVATIAMDAEAKSLRLVADIDDVGKIEGDERRLRQMLNNVLLNAMRFTPTGGQIIVETAADIDTVSLTVRDNGIGIPEDEQARVFERFRKGSNAGPQGVGLGLALVREFVELHHGTVALRSIVNEGTEVVMRLPRRQPAP